MGTTQMEASATVLTGQKQIEMFRLLALRGALKLEILGMRGRGGRSAATIARMDLGTKTRSRTALLVELDAHIRDFARKNGLHEPTLG